MAAAAAGVGVAGDGGMKMLLETLESFVEAVVVADGNGIIQGFNRGAERMFGYAQREAVGTFLTLLMPEPYKSQHDAFLFRHQKFGRTSLIGKPRVLPAVRKNGEGFHIRISLGKLKGIECYVATLNEVIVKKQEEEEGEEEEEEEEEAQNQPKEVPSSKDQVGHRQSTLTLESVETDSASNLNDDDSSRAGDDRFSRFSESERASNHVAEEHSDAENAAENDKESHHSAAKPNLGPDGQKPAGGTIKKKKVKKSTKAEVETEADKEEKTEKSEKVKKPKKKVKAPKEEEEATALAQPPVGASEPAEKPKKKKKKETSTLDLNTKAPKTKKKKSKTIVIDVHQEETRTESTEVTNLKKELFGW